MQTDSAIKKLNTKTNVHTKRVTMRRLTGAVGKYNITRLPKQANNENLRTLKSKPINKDIAMLSAANIAICQSLWLC